MIGCVKRRVLYRNNILVLAHKILFQKLSFCFCSKTVAEFSTVHSESALTEGFDRLT